MSLRLAVVMLDTATVDVTEFCRAHKISTTWFYDLRKRYAAEGEAGLVARSRAPINPAGRTPPWVEDEVVTIRKELVDAGLDAGPATVRFHLRGRVEPVPSEATIWRILRARGQIAPHPNKAPKPRGSFTAARANECWALDDTTWTLADGSEVKILNVIDDHSRLLVASVVVGRSCTGAATLAALATAANQWGWPERIWADNAKAFKDTLANALRPLGVITSHTKPYHPHSNGKVERFHQTLKQWLDRQPAATTTTELQDLLDRFQTIYNTQRPHRSIGRRYPADVWTNAEKTGPGDRPLGTPTTTTTHTATVHNGYAVASRYLISIGAAHTGRQALTIITDTNAHVFIDGHLVRQLTINPANRIQPLYNRPGRPTTNPRPL